MKYRKKSVVVEAFQFGVDKMPIWFGSKIYKSDCLITYSCDGCLIKTLEGEMEVSVGEMIIKGIQGEIYPCKKDIFDQTYEKVEE